MREVRMGRVVAPKGGGSMLPRVALLWCLMSVFVLPGTAAAYVDRGTDPDDRAPVRFDPDIRATIRRVEPGEQRRKLAVVVRAYEDFGFLWQIDVRLDARGGPAADTRMRLWNADTGGMGCEVWKCGHRGQAVEGAFALSADRTRCSAPIGLIEPSKRIRWRLISEGYDEESETDRAPDVGWYG